MFNVRYPIFVKLLFLCLILLIGASGVISYYNSQHFTETVLKREEEINLSAMINKGDEVDKHFNRLIEKSRFYTALLMTDQSNQWIDLLSKAMSSDQDLVMMSLYKSDLNNPEVEFIQSDFLKRYEKSPEEFKYLKEGLGLPLDEVLQGKMIIYSFARETSMPIAWLGIPLTRDSGHRVNLIASIFINLERLQPIFETSGYSNSFLVDQRGRVLAHSNQEQLFKDLEPIFEKTVNSSLKSEISFQQFFEGERGARVLMGVAKNQTGSTIISYVPESLIVNPVRYGQQMALYVFVVVLAICLFFVTFISQSFTSPIERLLKFTKRIAQGEFDLDIASSVSTRDEVGSLALAMDDMAVGLKEREKIKNVMQKFHGAPVAEELIKGELSLRGDRKEVVVFFSDIRSFTEISESAPPEEIVEMLNEYLDIMVRIIYTHGGIVDKFVGDAIMAVWGVPRSIGGEEQQAIRACLEMRRELHQLNLKRLERGERPLMIGMGLHAGEVISGTVGSVDRMEYTIIGDTVNTAARIEASTKAFGTDLLISEALFKRTESQFINTKAGHVEAKGKSSALLLYKVEGLIHSDGSQEIIRTPYSHFTPEASGEKTKVVNG